MRTRSHFEPLAVRAGHFRISSRSFLSFYRWTNGGPRSPSSSVAEQAWPQGQDDCMLFCTSSWDTQLGSNERGGKDQPVKSWLLLPLEPSRFPASLAPTFLGIYIQWIHCTQICAFGLIRLEAEQILKSVFRSLNTLLPWKRHGFFIQLPGLMFLNLETQWGNLILINCYINKHEVCR